MELGCGGCGYTHTLDSRRLFQKFCHDISCFTQHQFLSLSLLRNSVSNLLCHACCSFHLLSVAEEGGGVTACRCDCRTCVATNEVKYARAKRLKSLLRWVWVWMSPTSWCYACRIAPLPLLNSSPFPHTPLCPEIMRFFVDRRRILNLFPVHIRNDLHMMCSALA